MVGVLSKSISAPIFIHNNLSMEILECSQIIKEFTLFLDKVCKNVVKLDM